MFAIVTRQPLSYRNTTEATSTEQSRCEHTTQCKLFLLLCPFKAACTYAINFITCCCTCMHTLILLPVACRVVRAVWSPPPSLSRRSHRRLSLQAPLPPLQGGYGPRQTGKVTGNIQWESLLCPYYWMLNVGQGRGLVSLGHSQWAVVYCINICF